MHPFWTPWRGSAAVAAPARWQTGSMTAPTPDPDNLVWSDLEMTGLDPINDVILQVALVITDAQLRPLDDLAFDVWQPEEPLRRMIPLVREMHERTGLVTRVRQSTIRLPEVERAV